MQLPGLGGERPQTDADNAEQGRLIEIAQRATYPLATAATCAVYWAATEYIDRLPQFNQPGVAIFGAVAAAAGIKIVRSQDTEYAAYASEALYPDDKQRESASRTIRKQRITAAAGATAAALAFTAQLLSSAGPYTELSRQRVTAIGAVVDVGWESYTNDVNNSDGEPDIRLNVGFNSIVNSDKFFPAGSVVSIVAAGSEARGLGSVKVTTPEETTIQKERVVTAYETLVPFINTDSTSTSAITDALRSTGVVDAEKVVIVASGTKGINEVPKTFFEGESEQGNRRISIIALGGAETEANNDSENSPNIAEIEALVDEEDTYRAASYEEATDILNEIAKTQFSTTEQRLFTGFDTVRNAAVVLLAVGYGLGVVKNYLSRLNMNRKGRRT